MGDGVIAGVCVVCGAPLELAIGGGRRRLYCSKACKQKAYRQRVRARLEAAGRVTVPGDDESGGSVLQAQWVREAQDTEKRAQKARRLVETAFPTNDPPEDSLGALTLLEVLREVSISQLVKSGNPEFSSWWGKYSQLCRDHERLEAECAQLREQVSRVGIDQLSVEQRREVTLGELKQLAGQVRHGATVSPHAPYVVFMREILNAVKDPHAQQSVRDGLRNLFRR